MKKNSKENYFATFVFVTCINLNQHINFLFLWLGNKLRCHPNPFFRDTLNMVATIFCSHFFSFSGRKLHFEKFWKESVTFSMFFFFNPKLIIINGKKMLKLKFFSSNFEFSFSDRQEFLGNAPEFKEKQVGKGVITRK